MPITFERAFNNGDIILPEVVEMPEDYASDLLYRHAAPQTDKLMTMVINCILDGSNGNQTLDTIIAECFSEQARHEIRDADEINYECARMDKARRDFAEDAAEWEAQRYA